MLENVTLFQKKNRMTNKNNKNTKVKIIKIPELICHKRLCETLSFLIVAKTQQISTIYPYKQFLTVVNIVTIKTVLLDKGKYLCVRPCPRDTSIHVT